jgi:hypothetical protein
LTDVQDLCSGERLPIRLDEEGYLDDVLTKAKALHSAGMLPRSELMKLSVHQLDARILLVREQMKPTTTEINPPRSQD